MNPLHTEDTEFVAEALLALAGEDRERPVCDEETLTRRLAHSLRQARTADIPVRAQDPFLRAEVRRAIARSRMTDHQRDVFRLRQAGLTFGQIAAMFRSTGPAVRRSFIRALARLKEACDADPWHGLSDVYRHETRRRT